MCSGQTGAEAMPPGHVATLTQLTDFWYISESRFDLRCALSPWPLVYPRDFGNIGCDVDSLHD